MTSDYRLKEDIAPAEAPALPTLLQLKPMNFRFRDIDGWKSDGKRHLGFIAHELAEVMPCAVSGEKDAVTEGGRMLPQSLNVLPLIALLTQAVQELTARVAALEAR